MSIIQLGDKHFEFECEGIDEIRSMESLTHFEFEGLNYRIRYIDKGVDLGSSATYFVYVV